MSSNPLILTDPSGDPIVIRRSGQAKRLSLRLSRLDGRVTLTAPKGVSDAVIRGFVQEKRDWLRHHLADMPAPVLVQDGVQIPIEGRMVPIIQAPGPAGLHEGRLRLRPGRAAGPQAAAILRQLARARLADYCDRACVQIGRSYSKLTLRDTRSRWGSCTAEGGLMFSWRIIMAPPRILDYLAAHEVSHLVHMNHSKAFWGQVAQLHPSAREDRAWLHEYGADLHRYRFSD
ncbi:MAG: M48 family metallopeptidase [Mangrovicoccus sp.]